MIFSSPIFLFLFLPAVLASHFLAPRPFRNTVLLIFSLFFYAWGEHLFLLLMIASISFNYIYGLWLSRSATDAGRRTALGTAVATNLGLLAAFKYANFLVDNLNKLSTTLQLPTIELEPVHLPIGISFFTFQALSYVIDLYRGEVEVQRSPIRIAVYISLFPQLIAGPIVRYGHIASQLSERTIDLTRFAAGIRRFVIGMGKKVLIANVVAIPADQVFALPGNELTTSLAWLGVVCYTLQIYFDFSGYSDMAIGLGQMFGFDFPENFNYPYISQSIQEFWRRWHITLSTWFRDYLYIPMGGSRGSSARTYFNLFTVFFLCGLWHGASWTFVFWGLFHGAFLVLERIGLRSVLDAGPVFIRRTYVLLVVMVGWVFFRAESFGAALTFLSRMIGRGDASETSLTLAGSLSNLVMLAIVAGVIGSGPVVSRLVTAARERLLGSQGSSSKLGFALMSIAGVIGLFTILILSAMELASGTHNPFLYFRF